MKDINQKDDPKSSLKTDEDDSTIVIGIRVNSQENVDDVQWAVKFFLAELFGIREVK